MPDEQFSELIATAQKRAKDREAQATSRREIMAEAVKSKQEVLHTVVHRTLLQAWRDLESAGVKASVDTGANPRGDWQIALRIVHKPEAPALVFSVITGTAVHLAYSKEYQTPREEVTYDLIDDATPVEIAQIVGNYLSEALG